MYIPRFNRYIVECKYIKDADRLQYLSDLIDTQWNVNTRQNIRNGGLQCDLIDTQWNVNLHKMATLLILIGFNRYIVECKFG